MTMTSSMEPSIIVPCQTFALLEARRVTGTHLFRIDGYSAARRWVVPSYSIDSPTFSACAHNWKLSFYPNGTGWRPGPASVKLELMEQSKDGVMAVYRLSILDGAGNPAYSYCVAPHKYSQVSDKEKSTSVNVLATPEEREAVLLLVKDDCLDIRCDIMMTRSIGSLASRCSLESY
ncbi:hypothetical protein QOZ80_9AG0690230 [Eleusine coracana subsp. coracana]|nr:hypothetical protein QOZ80_9AG0690230 [Eleusine coracana subsp. coracana]